MERICAKCQYDNLEGKILTHHNSDVIFHEGDKLEYIYFINSGYVKMARYLENGDERIIGILGPGDYIALLAVLQDKDYYLATAIAITETVIKRIPQKSVIDSYNRSNDFKDKCLKCAVTRSNTFKNYLVNSSNTDVNQKILDALLMLYEKYGYFEGKLHYLDLPFSKTVFANLIGIRRETLSRHLSRLQDEGIIKVHKNSYLLYYV